MIFKVQDDQHLCGVNPVVSIPESSRLSLISIPEQTDSSFFLKKNPKDCFSSEETYS